MGKKVFNLDFQLRHVVQVLQSENKPNIGRVHFFFYYPPAQALKRKEMKGSIWAKGMMHVGARPRLSEKDLSETAEDGVVCSRKGRGARVELWVRVRRGCICNWIGG